MGINDYKVCIDTKADRNKSFIDFKKKETILKDIDSFYTHYTFLIKENEYGVPEYFVAFIHDLDRIPDEHDIFVSCERAGKNAYKLRSKRIIQKFEKFERTGGQKLPLDVSHVETDYSEELGIKIEIYKLTT